jgi:hypothetical protein
MEKTKEISKYLMTETKLIILENVRRFKTEKEALTVFGIPRSSSYKWKKVSLLEGATGLLEESCKVHHPRKLKQEIVDKVISLRKEFQLGSWRIKWYLKDNS